MKGNESLMKIEEERKTRSSKCETMAAVGG